MTGQSIDIFISYANPDKEMMENLKSRFATHDICAWVFSADNSAGANTWVEIKQKITSCRLVLWVYSKHSEEAEGQTRELDVYERSREFASSKRKLVPVVYDMRFGELPERLRDTNGLELSLCHVDSFVLEVIDRFFPERSPEREKRAWHYPRPADWLEVCDLKYGLDSDLKLGDRAYFRRLSPLGLFECYVPAIDGLYWFAPNNTKLISMTESEQESAEGGVPIRYRVSTMIDVERAGLRTMEEAGTIPLPADRGRRRGSDSAS